MNAAERERAITDLKQTRDRLLRATSGLSPAQMQFKPAADRWSVAQCLEHLVTVENRATDGISNALREAPDSAKRSAFEGRDGDIVQVAGDRTNRRQAPEAVQPSGRFREDQLVREFEAARERTIRIAASTEYDLRKHFFAHRAFGELDCYQWMLLVAAHSDRHRVQIEEVIASSNFPRSAAAV